MHNSKLYSILEHFDRYEQNRLRKYLTSPYFNRNQTLVELFELLVEDLNNGQEKNLDKEHLWIELNLDAPYDDVRFRKYASDLLKLVEGYLIQDVFEKSPLSQANFQMEAIANRKLEKLYSSTIRKARRLSRKQPDRSSNFFFYQYKIEKNYYDLSEFETKRADRHNVEEISRNLDYFYFSEKLRIYCGVLSQQRLISYDYDLLFLDEIIDHISHHGYDKVPPVALYYQIYLTHIEPENEEHYYKFKSLLDQYGLKFPNDEAKDQLYMAAQNYCIRKINQGNSKFLKELFILYRDLLEKGIILADGVLSPWYFRNIVVIGLRLGEFEWTEQFITRYQNHLPESFRENAVTFNLAQLYFYQNKYDKVIEQLRNVEYEDVSYNLNSKAMLMATYYETDEIDPLYSLMDSFRTYLNRHKDIPEERRKPYNNLIRFTKRLTKILPGDEKPLEKLKKDIESHEGQIGNVNWLKQKIAELERTS